MKNVISFILFTILPFFSITSANQLDSLGLLLANSTTACEQLEYAIGMIKISPKGELADSLLRNYCPVIENCSDRKLKSRFKVSCLRLNLTQLDTIALLATYDDLYAEAIRLEDKEYELRNRIIKAAKLWNFGMKEAAIHCLEQSDFDTKYEAQFPVLFIGRHYNCGNYLLRQFRYEEALEHYFKAEVLCTTYKQMNILSLVNNNISLIYRQINNIELSKQFLLKSVPYIDTTSSNAAILFYNLGTRYREQDSLNKAEYWIQRSLSLPNTIVGRNYSQLSMIYYKKGAYDKAKDYLYRKETIDFKNNTENEEDNWIGKNALLAYATGDYSNALQLYQEAIRLCQKTNDPDYDNMLSYYEGYFKSKWQLKNSASDIPMLLAFKSTMDSIININNKEQVAQAKIKYEAFRKTKELNKKATELAEQKVMTANEVAKKQTYLIYVLLFMLLTGILLLFNFRIKSKQRQAQAEKQVLETQKELLEEEYEKLRMINQELADELDHFQKEGNTSLNFQEIKSLPVTFKKRDRSKKSTTLEEVEFIIWNRDTATVHFQDHAFIEVKGSIPRFFKLYIHPALFVQVNRSVVVNMSLIDTFDAKGLKMKHYPNVQIDWGKAYKDEGISSIENLS